MIRIEVWLKRWEKFGAWVDRYAKRIVVVTMVLFILVVSAAGAWKLWAFKYDAIDLAIYTQVLDHSIHGDLFGFTIHPHSYLGDHAEFILLALLPFYALARSSLTPIVVQAIALGLAVLPLFSIAKRHLPVRLAALVSVLFLINPFLANIGLFEFHALAFVVPLLLFLYDAYERKRLWLFAGLLLLALTVREDVGLFTLAFAAIALLDRRRWSWVVLPLGFSLGGFAASVAVSTMNSADGHYKFLAYYGWLGDSFSALARNAVVHPDRVILRLFHPKNLLFAFGLLLPSMFLPVVRLRSALLLVIPFAQIALGVGGSNIVLQTHYVAPFLPGLALGVVFGLKRLREKPSKPGGIVTLPLVTILLAVTTLYAALTFGPFPSVLAAALAPETDETRQLRQAFVEAVPRGVPVAATYTFLTPFSQHERLYSLSYVFTGRRQFSETPYILPADATHLLFDADDFLIFQAQYESDADRYGKGDDRLREVIADRKLSVRAWADRFILFAPDGASRVPVETIAAPPADARRVDLPLNDGLTLLATSDRLDDGTVEVDGKQFTVIPLSLYFSTDRENPPDDHLFLTARDDRGRIAFQRRFPIGYGLLPPHEWKPGEVVRMDVRLFLPASIRRHEPLTLTASVVREELRLGLDGIRSSELTVVKTTARSADVVLGQLLTPDN